jgi:hypothetical protein
MHVHVYIRTRSRVDMTVPVSIESNAKSRNIGARGRVDAARAFRVRYINVFHTGGITRSVTQCMTATRRAAAVIFLVNPGLMPWGADAHRPAGRSLVLRVQIKPIDRCSSKGRSVYVVP